MGSLSSEKLLYTKHHVKDVESEVGHPLKVTITEGLPENGALAFHLPPDYERFTNLNNILLQLEVTITTADGRNIRLVDAPPALADPVVLDMGGMHSLFKSCDVTFNNDIVSSMTMYPYTSALSRMLGTAKVVREVWDQFDKTWAVTNPKSDISANATPVFVENQMGKVSKNTSLIGRIYSDVLMSARQYLPPGVALGIVLRRAPDEFSLVCHKNTIAYKVKIHSASLYVERMQIQTPIMTHIRESLSDPHLTFNRLEARAMIIQEGSQVFRWPNCLNNGPLPNRLYVGFVAQASLYGSLTRLSTYFENLNVSSVLFKLNGRDMMVEPIRVSCVKDANGNTNSQRSDLTNGFLSVSKVTGQVEDQTSLPRLQYNDYVNGCTLFAVELGKCGQKSSDFGSLDMEVLSFFSIPVFAN